MSSEFVGYRYSRDELAALMLVLSVPSLPGAEPHAIDKPAYDRAMDSLAREGIVTMAGDRAYLDRISALLLKSIAGCDRWLRIRSGNRETLLYRCSALCVLADLPARGVCTLMPIERIDLAHSPLTDALSRHVPPLSIALPGSETECPDRAAAESALSNAFDALSIDHF